MRMDGGLVSALAVRRPRYRMTLHPDEALPGGTEKGQGPSRDQTHFSWRNGEQQHRAIARGSWQQAPVSNAMTGWTHFFPYPGPQGLRHVQTIEGP